MSEKNSLPVKKRSQRGENSLITNTSFKSSVKLVAVCIVIFGLVVSISILLWGSNNSANSNATTITTHRSNEQIANLLVASPRSVSCVTVNFCMAVDSIGDAAIFNGTSWSQVTAADPHSFLTSVSCVTVKFCVAVDGQADYIIYNGSTFSSPTAASAGLKETLTSVSCATTKFCVAVDSNGDELTFNGTTWLPLKSIDSKTQSTANYMVQVSCSTSNSCVSVDDAGNAVVYSNGKWDKPTAVDKVYPTGISCYGVQKCVLIDGSGSVVDYRSGTWSSPTLVDPRHHLNSISCNSSGNCMASDQSNNLFVGGANSGNWTAIPVSNLALNAISCSPTSASLACVVVGYGGSYVYSNSNLSSLISMNTNVNSFTSVSCVSSAFCMAVGSSGMFSIFNGTTIPTMGYVNLKEHGIYVTSVSCASTSFCMAVDQNGNSITYNGKWLNSQTIDPNGYLNSVSCVSSTFCMAVDGSGYALEYQGSARGWSQPMAIDVANMGLNSVSCVSSTFCMAVDDSGNYVIFNGTDWSKTASFASVAGFDYVSCFAGNSCTAVNQAGQSWLINPTGATTIQPQQPAVGVNGTVRGISCNSATTCNFASSSGSNLATVVPELPIGISCPNPSFCLEVTVSGNANAIASGARTSISN